MAPVTKTIDYNASKALHRITVKVTGLKLLSVRLRFAEKLFRLAAWVAGTRLTIEASPDE